MLVHNKLTMNTGFDFDLLQEELKNLTIDMSDFDLNLDDDEWTPVQPQGRSKIEAQFTPDGVVVGEVNGNDPYLPDGYDDDAIAVYTENQEKYVVKQRVIITYLPEQEQRLRAILGIESEKMKIVYDIDELSVK